MSREYNIKILEKVINKKREELDLLLKSKNNVIDDEVVLKSQELDKFLNTYNEILNDFVD